MGFFSDLVGGVSDVVSGVGDAVGDIFSSADSVFGSGSDSIFQSKEFWGNALSAGASAYGAYQNQQNTEAQLDLSQRLQDLREKEFEEQKKQYWVQAPTSIAQPQNLAKNGLLTNGLLVNLDEDKQKQQGYPYV